VVFSLEPHLLCLVLQSAGLRAAAACAHLSVGPRHAVLPKRTVSSLRVDTTFGGLFSLVSKPTHLSVSVVCWLNLYAMNGTRKKQRERAAGTVLLGAGALVLRRDTLPSHPLSFVIPGTTNKALPLCLQIDRLRRL
jgi:hypothetical protein